MTSDWMVVLEVVRRPIATPVNPAALQALLELLSESEPQRAQPIVLLAQDRYALHLAVTADNIPEAVITAIVRWQNVSIRLRLDGWDAHRAEVMTKDDFQKAAVTVVGHVVRGKARCGSGRLQCLRGPQAPVAPSRLWHPLGQYRGTPRSCPRGGAGRCTRE